MKRITHTREGHLTRGEEQRLVRLALTLEPSRAWTVSRWIVDAKGRVVEKVNFSVLANNGAEAGRIADGLKAGLERNRYGG